MLCLNRQLAIRGRKEQQCVAQTEKHMCQQQSANHGSNMQLCVATTGSHAWSQRAGKPFTNRQPCVAKTYSHAWSQHADMRGKEQAATRGSNRQSPDATTCSHTWFQLAVTRGPKGHHTWLQQPAMRCHSGEPRVVTTENHAWPSKHQRVATTLRSALQQQSDMHKPTRALSTNKASKKHQISRLA